MLTLNTLPEQFRSQIENAKALLAPFTKRAYLVGGSVRDMSLGMPLHDMDIEVYDIEPQAFDALMLRSGAVGVGKSFFVYKLGDIDFSLPRTERKKGVGHAAFEVELCLDEKEASLRRDFSMNAMMLNIFSGELLDFWGGLKSIEQKRIALIDEVRFREDSLRVLRAVQFSARLGFKIEKKSVLVMQSIGLDDLSKTRILWEFEKLFNASFLHYGLFYMYVLGVFEKCFTCKPPKHFLSIAKELATTACNFQKNLRIYYFMYIVANRLGYNPLEWLKRLDAPNHYLSTFRHQPFFEGELGDKALLHVSIDMPLSLWLGHYKKGVRERAKVLGVWDEAFSGGVSVEDVMKDGFTHKAIGLELRRRKIEKIKQLCEA